MNAAKVGCGSATAILGALTIFFWSLFPEKPMIAYPQMLGLLTLMPPIFYFIFAAGKNANKLTGIASCVIWVIGIALAFAIPPSSKFIYIPDGMLMLGFFPLLFLWRFSWPWIVFGILNFGIGILLMVIQYSPDNLFPADLLKPKHHLAEYHPAEVWLITGMIATAFGFGRLFKNIYRMIETRAMLRKGQTPPAS